MSADDPPIGLLRTAIEGGWITHAQGCMLLQQMVGVWVLRRINQLLGQQLDRHKRSKRKRATILTTIIQETEETDDLPFAQTLNKLAKEKLNQD